MQNIKDLIQNTFNNTDNIESTMNTLSGIQNNLMKNYSNPVFNSTAKDKLMNMYNTIKDLGNSLYKFTSFKKNNMQEEAKNEQQNSSDIVLKGGISNVKYVWHSENGENTCEKCKSLDGTTYDFADEVPERPHPNCKCHVEIVEDKNQEVCDCHKFIDRINGILDEINTLRNVIAIKISNMKELMMYDLELGTEQIGQWFLEQYSQMDNVLGDLTSAFVESRENIYANSDKYYHMKAYCKVAQRESEISNKIAELSGEFREAWQFTTEVISQQENYTQALKNYHADKNANKTGFELGTNFPNDSCDDIIKILWTDLLDKIYKDMQ